MTEGGVGGNDTDGAGSDDGTDGEGGNPPQAAVVNAAISSIPILVSFKFAARFLNQHNHVGVKLAVVVVLLFERRTDQPKEQHHHDQSDDAK